MKMLWQALILAAAAIVVQIALLTLAAVIFGAQSGIIGGLAFVVVSVVVAGIFILLPRHNSAGQEGLAAASTVRIEPSFNIPAAEPNDVDVSSDSESVTIEPKPKRPHSSGVFERSSAIALATVLYFLLRVFVWQPITVYGSGMLPTIKDADIAVVTKFSYGYSWASFPFGFVSYNGRVLGASPERGDLIMYRDAAGSSDTVARAIGLPGDTVQMVDGWLQLNSLPVSRDDTRYKLSRIRRETLPNGATYDTFDLLDDGAFDNTKLYLVPSGHVFVLGDNRDRSGDSRSEHIGYVPLEDIVGRVLVLF